MRIHQIGGLGFDSNIYLIVDEIVALIDAGTGQHRREVESKMRKLGVRAEDVGLIVNTHCHYDHAGGDHHFIEASNCGLAIHELEAEFLRRGDPEVTLAGIFGVEPEPLEVSRELREGDEIKLGESVLKVLHTPGHTKGCISLYEQQRKVLFSGDTVFCGGVGRVDLPTSDRAAMGNSLRKLASLDVEELLPGHGPGSKSAMAHIREALAIFKRS